MADWNFAAGGPAPTSFHNGPHPQPTGACPAVGGKPAGPVVVKTGATQNGVAKSSPADNAGVPAGQ